MLASGQARGVAALLGPFAWFAVRDVWVGLDAVAIMLPMLLQALLDRRPDVLVTVETDPVLDEIAHRPIVAEWAGLTSFRPFLFWEMLLLRIDHILVSDDLCAEDAGRFNLPGSDHWGVWSTIGRCKSD